MLDFAINSANLDSYKLFTSHMVQIFYNGKLRERISAMSRMKKSVYFVTAVVILLVLVGIVYFLSNPRPVVDSAPMGAENTPQSTRSLGETIGATGTVSSNQSADLSWKTSGVVGEIYFNVGDVVKAGEVLAHLEQNSLSPMDILAQADLVEAQKAFDDLIESHTQRASALKAVETAQEALDDALNPELAQAAALQALSEAEKDVEEAENKLGILTAPVSQAVLDQAQANLVLLEKKINDNQGMIDRIQKKLNRRDEQFKPWESRSRYKKLLEVLEIQHLQLHNSYEDSKQKFLDLQNPPDPIDATLAEANLQNAQAELLEAKREWERIKDGPSSADIALLEAQLTDARREWERVKDGPAEEDLAIAQARIAAAKAALERIVIVAPFSGTITEVYIQVNDQVGPGTPAFRLDDLSQLWVEVGVSEIDINRVKIGQPVFLTFDGILAKEYQGEVAEVSPVGTISLGVVDFEVKVVLSNADRDVRPGMTAAVEIQASQDREALLDSSKEAVSMVGQNILNPHGSLKLGEHTSLVVSKIYSLRLDNHLSAGNSGFANPTWL